MKRTLLLLLTLLGAINAFGQNYLILWNSSTSKYQIKQVNTSTGALTDIGTSSTMSSSYDIDQIYYDAANNQIVGLYQDTDLWKYNLTTNTDQVVDLGSVSYRCLVLGNNTAYVLMWNTSNNVYEVKELNLSTGGLTFIGSTSNISGYTDLNEVFYDAANNQLIGLKWGNDLWTFSLTTFSDAIVNIPGSDYYKSLAFSNSEAFLLFWNTNKYEIYDLNITTGNITLLGASTQPTPSPYDINEIYYDVANNQIVALYKYTGLWKYSLSSNSDAVTSMGTDQYRDLEVYNGSSTTPVVDPVALSDSDDEIVKVYDMMGRELPTIETGKVLILVYKSGKTKKVFIKE